MAEAPAKQSYSTDPALYIYTSLTAGSSHIVTATSRLETILKANRVPFKAIDIATDEKARMLWGRRAGKDEGGRMRKLPGLVQMGLVLGAANELHNQDLVEIEDWNEYGELKQHVKIYYDEFTIPAKGAAQIANPLKPIYGKPTAGAPSASSTPYAPLPKPVPAAPPLPEKKETQTTKQTGEAKKSTAAAVVAPGKSIAEEAAQKARQVRLDGLRAKVHGTANKDKEAAASKDGAEDEKKATATPLNKETSAADSSTGLTRGAAEGADKTAGAGGLQSPTTGAWKTTSQEDNLRNVLQSPTSGTWKSGGAGLSLPIREHRGSSVVEGSEEEIVAIEKAEAIPEGAVEDEEDDEDDDEDDEESSEDDDDDDDDGKVAEKKKK
ncbi:neurofilament protein H, form H2 [Seiridium cupressi]